MSPAVLVLWSFYNKVPQVKWFKQNNCFVSHFWGLEKSRSQQDWFILKTVRERLIPDLSLKLVGDHRLSLSLHLDFSPCLPDSKFPLFIRIPIILD